jgi:hypothetical protein
MPVYDVYVALIGQIIISTKEVPLEGLELICYNDDGYFRPTHGFIISTIALPAYQRALVVMSAVVAAVYDAGPKWMLSNILVVLI